jgi:polyhydroxybutyrate depolymerase
MHGYGRSMPTSISRRPSRIALAAALLVGLLVGGCAAPPAPSVGGSSSPTPALTLPVTAPVAPSESPAAVISEQPLFSFGDDERRLRLYRPDPMPSGKVPLVLFLHASGDTPARAASETGLDRLAGSNGFIAVFPPAAGRGWGAGVTPGLPDSAVDSRWLSALLDDLLATESIDPGRVFVAGFSIGAVMADRLACQLADRIAGAVVVAGTPWAGGDCAPAQPVSMLIIHGTADPTFPYDRAEDLARQWREIDQCDATAPAATVGSSATRVEATGCANGTGVDFVTVPNGVHMWFGDPDATTLAWEFLTDHAR